MLLHPANYTITHLIHSADISATWQPVVGKHPDLMVGYPTSTVFPTKDRNFEISQFFAKNFEKV